MARTDLHRFVDLRRSTYDLVEKAPDDRENTLNRGPHLSNGRVNSPVGPVEKRHDLADTEKRVRVEGEREVHLPTREVLLMKRRSVCEDRIKIAVTAPDPVEIVTRHTALVTAPWTGRILLELLVSPLNAAIERLRADFDETQLSHLPKHPAEHRLSRRHTPKLSLAQCDYTILPQLCIIAIGPSNCAVQTPFCAGNPILASAPAILSSDNFVRSASFVSYSCSSGEHKVIEFKHFLMHIYFKL